MDITAYIVESIFIILGLFYIIVSVFNVDWFFSGTKGQVYVRWFGRNGTRVFYFILGVLLIVFGIIGIFYWEA